MGWFFNFPDVFVQNDLLKRNNAHKTKLKKKLSTHEPRHDKTNKVSVCPAKTQISLGISPV